MGFYSICKIPSPLLYSIGKGSYTTFHTQGVRIIQEYGSRGVILDFCLLHDLEGNEQVSLPLRFHTLSYKWQQHCCI